MEKGTILDRRESCDRRNDGASRYAGPEKRKSGDRRSGKITVCIFCGEVCGGQRGWVKSPLAMETAADLLVDVCEDCYSKRFAQSYHKNRSPK